MLLPEVVGFKLTGKLPEGATATDLVLTVTQMLRKHGVVGQVRRVLRRRRRNLSLADRATIANMAPEYGATMGFFPVDDETLPSCERTGRSEEQIELVEAYCKAQGLFCDAGAPQARVLRRRSSARPGDGRAEPRRPEAPAGPRRAARRAGELPQTSLRAPRRSRTAASASPASRRRGHRRDRRTASTSNRSATAPCDRRDHLVHEHVNPSVMLAAGLLARKAAHAASARKPWVKTSLAPGSRVVTDYLQKAGLIERSSARLPRRRLRLHDLHRQLGPLPDVGPHRDRGTATSWPPCSRQPQLRGPRQSRREGQLPRLAAAGRRLRARGHRRHRPRQGPARHGHQTASRSS
jgi:aconitate hydratase